MISFIVTDTRGYSGAAQSGIVNTGAFDMAVDLCTDRPSSHPAEVCFHNSADADIDFAHITHM